MIDTVASATTLKHFKSQLEQLSFTGEKEVSRIMALAECDFRLAVHRDTSDDVAVSLLREAVRIDGTNPKYSYHLGRIELKRGRFQQAARWYRIACCLTPTSHRIWFHLALLQRDLNEQYKGDERFEPNVLLKRSESILNQIREGRDNIDPSLLDFIPPKSLAVMEQEARLGLRRKPDFQEDPAESLSSPSEKVRRYVNSGVCRCPGIDQLFVEQTLEGRATQSNIKKLTPVLQSLAEGCSDRPGQPAALAILLVQWILSGYPVSSARRLAEFIPQQLPSRLLIETVCELYEIPEQDLSERITAAIELEQIPCLLGSLIHRERLLWRPWEFNGLGAYRAASRILEESKRGEESLELDEETQGEIRELIRRLDSSLDSFLGSKPKELKDHIPIIEPESSRRDRVDLLAVFAAYVHAAVRLEQFKEEGFRLLKEELEPGVKGVDSEDHFTQLTNDRQAAERFLQLLSSQTENGLARFMDLCKRIADAQNLTPGLDFSSHREECVGRLQGISSMGKFTKILKRIDKQLESPSENYTADAGNPSAEWSALLAGLEGVLPDEAAFIISGPGTISLADRLHQLETAASGLLEVREGLSDLLRTHFDVATSEGAEQLVVSQAAVDAAHLESLLKELEDLGKRGLDKLEALRQDASSASEEQRPSESETRFETATNQFRIGMNLGSLKRRLLKTTRSLNATAPIVSEREASDPITVLKQKIQSLFQDSEAPQHAAADSDPISEWLAQSDTFNSQIDEDWLRLKELVDLHKADGLTEEATREARLIRSRVEEMLQLAEAAVAAIGELRQSATIQAADVDRLDSAQQGYLQVLKVRGKFLKNFSRLPDLAQVPEPATDDSTRQPPPDVGVESDFVNLLASQPARETTLETDGSPPAGTADSESGNPAANGDRAARQQGIPGGNTQEMTLLEKLADAVKRTRRTIDVEMQTALESLARYPGWIRRIPPFMLLSRSVNGRYAEILYRLGRRRSARSLWNRMLRTDRLDAPVLKNMAVCDTVDGDTYKYLVSWKEYLELLYLYDVISGSPDEHAAQRARMHRSFGNAYAPAFLSRKFDNDWRDSVEPASLLQFLGNRGRVGNFLRHRLLEYLNSRFEFTSPSLVLGIKRIEAESLGNAAQARMTQFVDSVAELISKRVSRPFAKLSVRTIVHASEACADTRRMTLKASPHYADEEKRQIELLVRLFDLNLKLIVAFRHNANMVKNLESLDFISELGVLDQIPLDVSPEIFELVANTMGVDAETLRDLSSTLRHNIVYALLEFLLGEDHEAEREPRLRQYQVLIGPWLHAPEGQEFKPLVDGPPFQFASKDAQRAFQETGSEEARMRYLRQWNDLYPAMAQYCLILVNILFSRSEFDEAYERIERTRKVAFHEPTRRSLHFMQVQVLVRRISPLIEKEDLTTALSIGLEMIELDDCQPGVPLQTISLYEANKQRSGKDYRRGELITAINQWIQRATVQANPSSEEQSLPVPSMEQIEEVRKKVETL